MYKQKSLMVSAVALMTAILVVGCTPRDTGSTASGTGETFETQTVLFPCNNTAQTGIPAEECQALVALYYATDGDNWTRNDNWLDTSKPASTWYGVTVSNGRVLTLSLRNNQLSGPIPAELGNLSNLRFLSLRGNQLSGPIPASLGQLSNLGDLYLMNNQLSGPIPAELGQLSKLRDLYIYGNQLSGPIPVELGQLSNLSNLYLSQNQLFGPIPAELGQLSNLSNLWLNNNQLSGPIPVELGQLSKITHLHLSDNQLSGPIPAELGQLSDLRYFSLSDNQLSGPIPAELGQMVNLEYLWLNNNQLSGPIPVELGQMTNLGFLGLNNNQLCGAIPTSFMYNGVWNHDNQPNYVNLFQNNLLDDQASYSAAMRGWLKSKGFVDANSNRIHQQTPAACGDTGGNGGSIGDSCGGENGECAEGYCFGYEPGKCVMGRHKGNAGSLNDPCAPITNENDCKSLPVDANGDGTIDKDAQCNWVDEQPGICKAPVCGDGIVDQGEQCDGKGQAQCGTGATCGAAGTRGACSCQYDIVVGPEVIKGDEDTSKGDGDGRAAPTFESQTTRDAAAVEAKKQEYLQQRAQREQAVITDTAVIQQPEEQEMMQEKMMEQEMMMQEEMMKQESIIQQEMMMKSMK